MSETHSALTSSSLRTKQNPDKKTSTNHLSLRSAPFVNGTLSNSGLGPNLRYEPLRQMSSYQLLITSNLLVDSAKKGWSFRMVDIAV